MNKTQLYLGTDLLDFNDSVNIKLQCYDMRSSEIGNSNKSYTLNIPLTRGNKVILEHFNLINSRKQITERMRLVIGGIELIRGLPRVLSVKNSAIKMIIDSDDWVADISGKSIRALSWDGGDTHEFNATNIENSWGDTAPLVHYPLLNFAELFTQETGSTAGIIPNDFVAMWNISQIVEKIFNDAGYAINGFFSDSGIQEYYILSEEQALEDDFIIGKGLDIDVQFASDNFASISHIATDQQTISLTKTKVEFNLTTLDEGSDWSSVNDEYTVPATGTYRFVMEFLAECDHNNDPDYTIIAQRLQIILRATSRDLVTHDVESTSAIDGTLLTFDSGWVHLEAGEKVTVFNFMRSEAINDGITRTVELFIDTPTNLISTWDKRNLSKGIGITIDPTVHLPDVDGLDFLISLKELFNLRFWLDQYNKTVYIESDPDFVGTTVIDWTDKVDYSKGIGQEIIAASYFKNQAWQYAPDTGDKAYTNRVANSGIPFKKEITLTNASVKIGTNTRINSVFSPTILGNMSQIGHTSGIIPRIFSSDDFISDTKAYPAYRAKKWKPRILKWVSGVSSLGTGAWRWFESMQDFFDDNYTNKTVFPKCYTVDYSDLYDDYWARSFHFIDGSRALTVTVNLKPHELMAFITVVGTAANEGFRAKYKINVDNVDMYFYLTQIISNGLQGKVIAIQNM